MNRLLSAIMMSGIIALTIYAERGHVSSIYGIAVFSLLILKLVASLMSRSVELDEKDTAKVARLTVAVLLTVYNEDVTAFRRCLDSLLNQTRLPNAIAVVDDCSTDKSALQLACEYEPLFRARGVDYRVIAFEVNRGKRHGLAAGIRQFFNADIYLGVDSDTELDEYAVEKGMLPFASRRVNAVTGLVLALNARKNVLTRLIDLRYANAFLFERAAYSLLGSVLCCCGSLAFYRGTVIRENLDDFLGQRFLGREATYGDDRRLTNYCLKNGRAVMQSSAVAWTLVPERMKHYLKQQTRWSKSFFRESLWVIQQGRMDKPAFWLSLVELTSWITFTGMLLAAIVLLPFKANPELLLFYAMYTMLLGYARSVRFLEPNQRTRMPMGERFATFLLAPLYGLMHVGLLMWVRVYAMATLRDNAWGTRQGGAEVVMEAT
jgi:Glycosyltransferases, probably involved in cell wall biogenesis